MPTKWNKAQDSFHRIQLMLTVIDSCFILFCGHDNAYGQAYHVRIIVASWFGEVAKLILIGSHVIHDKHHAWPGVLDVLEVTPCVTILGD